MKGALVASMMDGDWGGAWVVVIVVVMIVMMAGMAWMMLSMMRSDGHGSSKVPSPRDELAGRYARGELTTDEYQERLRLLDEASR